MQTQTDGITNKINSKNDGVADKLSGKVDKYSKEVKNFVEEAEEIAHNLPRTLEAKMDALRDSSQQVLEKTEKVLKQHPFYTLLGAAAVGALTMAYISHKMNNKH